MTARIICDLVAWWAAAGFAICLRFGPEERTAYFFGHLDGFLITGLFWAGCRAVSYWAAAKLHRRRLSVLLSGLCPILTLAFCGTVSYVLLETLIGRGVFFAQLLFAGWLWGLSSEIVFNPARHAAKGKDTANSATSRPCGTLGG